MTPKNKIELILSATDATRLAFTTVDTSLVSLESRLDRAAAKVHARSEMIHSSLTKIGTGLAAYFGFQQLEQSLEKFGDYEMSLYRLAGSLQQIGAGGMAAAGSLQKNARQIELWSGVSEKAIIDAMGLGVSLAHLSGQDLLNATQAALGWADILGKDVHETMLMITKAANGNMTAFERLGVNFDDCADKAAKFHKVLAEGQSGFEITKSMADTTGRQLQNLKNQLEHTREAYGRTLSDVVTFNMGPVVWLMDKYQKYVEWGYGPLNRGGNLPAAPRMEKDENIGELREEAKAREKINEIILKTTEDLFKMRYGEEAYQVARMRAEGADENQIAKIEALSELRNEITAENELKKIRLEVLELEKGKDEILREQFFNSKNITIEQYDELVRWQDRKKAIEDNIKVNKEFAQTLEGMSKNIFEKMYGKEAGTAWNLLKMGADSKDVSEMLYLIREINKLNEKGQNWAADSQKGWQPTDAGMMRGYRAPQTVTIDHAAKTAQNTTKMIELLQRIEILQEKIAIEAKNRKTVNVRDN